MAEEEKIILPDGFLECEYLSANGKSRIQTPYNGSDIIVETVVTPAKHANAYMAPFGAYADYLGYAIFHYSDIGWSLNKSSGKNFSFQLYEKVQIKAKLLISEEYSIECWMNNTLDGNYTQSFKQTSSKLQTCFGFNLFSPRNDNTADAFYGAMFYCKIFGLKGNILSHYIPALRLSDNKPGMYDVIREEFLTNKGGEEFIYKPKQS